MLWARLIRFGILEKDLREYSLSKIELMARCVEMTDALEQLDFLDNSYVAFAACMTTGKPFNEKLKRLQKTIRGDVPEPPKQSPAQRRKAVEAARKKLLALKQAKK